AVWLARHFPRARVSFRANNQIAQATAAKASAGIALLPHYIGRAEPALRACALQPVPPPRELWLLKRRQDRKSPAIQAVVDHITKVFAKGRGLFDPPPEAMRSPSKGSR